MATSLEGSHSGLAPFSWPAAKKPLQTWYRVFGDLNSPIIPLVLIHGGPGFCHNYLLNHRFLTDTYRIPTILYDTIGSGLSTHLPETASQTAFPDFWTVEIFYEQLRQLLAHLGLGLERPYDLLGSSWGGMIGSVFAASRPPGLRRLVLANAPASKALSLANRRMFRMQLPREMRDVLDRVEREKVWDGKEASVVMAEFARRHECNVFPFPEDLLASGRAYNEDRTVANTIGGDGPDGNPFQAAGYLATWTAEGKLHTVAVPTLVLTGFNEFGSGDAAEPFLREIPDVRLVTLEGTTHSPHLERKEEYMKIVGDFLSASSL